MLEFIADSIRRGRKEKLLKYNNARMAGATLFPEIALDDSDIDRCTDFASKYDYSAASSRHSSGDIGKFMSDNIAGKLGEIVVMKSMPLLGMEMDEPDFTILDNMDKSFASDIMSRRGDRFSVKSCYNYDFPVSWTLQYTNSDGNGGKDRHFFGADDSLRMGEWFCGVILSHDMRKGSILWLAPMQTLYDNRDVLYELPIKEDLKRTKRVVYWSTVVEHGFDRQEHTLENAMKGCIQ